MQHLNKWLGCEYFFFFKFYKNNNKTGEDYKKLSEELNSIINAPVRYNIYEKTKEEVFLL